jgi:hypothetical protein
MADEADYARLKISAQDEGHEFETFSWLDGDVRRDSISILLTSQHPRPPFLFLSNPPSGHLDSGHADHRLVCQLLGSTLSVAHLLCQLSVLCEQGGPVKTASGAVRAIRR